MTFCAGLKVKDGLIGIADTRVTTRTEQIVARKLNTYQNLGYEMFIMTSGLRSIRDKTLTYFDELIENEEEKFDKLYEAVNSYAAQLRLVAKEDKKALNESGLQFNLHTIIGGRLEKDKEHKLFLLYPQGNWVEVGKGTPYFLIGESSFGKPILDRVLRYESTMKTALKAGFLAFDATRASAVDADFPIDIVVYKNDCNILYEYRFSRNDLIELSTWWQQYLSQAIEELPAECFENIFKNFPKE
ncbi:MAG: peptidase [Thermodesulfobacteriota bacterium]